MMPYIIFEISGISTGKVNSMTSEGLKLVKLNKNQFKYKKNKQYV